MKKTTTTLGVILLILLSGVIDLSAQEKAYTVSSVTGYRNDVKDLSKLPKMERDIEILKNVLGELFEGPQSLAFSNWGAKGMHIAGNGVIFNLDRPRYGNLEVLRVRPSTPNEEEEEEELTVEEYNREQENSIRTKSKEFLANYGSLLSELKPGEQVMLNVDYTERRTREKIESRGKTISIFPNSIKNRMQSSISYKTISDLNSGKINLEQAMNAVESKIVEDAGNEMNDARILAGILDDLLQSSMDGKFKRRGKTTWSYFDGFGIMYNIQMISTMGGGVYVYNSGSGSNSISVVAGRDKEKQAEREETLKSLEEAYPAFEKMLKENIVQYGRTLRSLKEGESLILNVDLGRIQGSEKIPASIRMVIPKSSIDAYARGQKSLEKVIDEIEVTELQSSANLGGGMIYEASGVPAVFETIPEPPKPLRGAVRSKQK